MELRKHEHLHSEENLVAYVRFSSGAIEVHEDYVVCHKNWLPFERCTINRVSAIFTYENIADIVYKKHGWLIPGFFGLRPKYVRGINGFLIFSWKFWAHKRIRNEFQPVYDFIFNKVHTNWNKGHYIKVQTADNLKKLGYCPVCDNTLEEGSSFCPNCGNKIGE